MTPKSWLRARNKLTTRQVAALTNPGVYSDGGGLYLRVRPNGRSWIHIGTLYGKRIELGLGLVFDVPLAKAREKSAEIRAMLLEGRDPREERKKVKPARKVEVVTFGSFAKQLIADIEDGFKNPKHRQQWRNTIETYGAPMANIPIADVSTDDVLSVLKPIWLSKPETASRVRGRIERILDAAKVKGLRSGENPARGRGHLDLLLPSHKNVETKHHAALPHVKIAAFMVELRQREAVAARALEFTILTAARSGEVRGVTWGEIDIAAKLWAVPAKRMKMNKDHRVPLSEAALAILTSMHEEGLKPSDYVFPAPRGGSLSDMALSQLLKRMGHAAITVHGFRSTFRDWAADKTDFASELAEVALAHKLGDTVTRAYLRTDMLEERCKMMAAWADYCAGITTSPDAPAAGDEKAT